MKVGDFIINKTDYTDFVSYINSYFINNNIVNTDFIALLLNDKITEIIEKYKHNYFVEELKQEEYGNIMIYYFEQYAYHLNLTTHNFAINYANVLQEYETLKTKLKTNHSKKYLVSENISTNELNASNTNSETNSSTLNTEKINQGTPVNTDIYAVGNTISAEKGKNTNAITNNLTATNTENATNTSISNFNVSYFLSLDNFNSFVELDIKLNDLIIEIFDKYFYNTFKKIFIDSIDFEKIERIRGV